MKNSSKTLKECMKDDDNQGILEGVDWSTFTSQRACEKSCGGGGGFFEHFYLLTPFCSRIIVCRRRRARRKIGRRTQFISCGTWNLSCRPPSTRKRRVHCGSTGNHVSRWEEEIGWHAARGRLPLYLSWISVESLSEKKNQKKQSGSDVFGGDNPSPGNRWLQKLVTMMTYMDKSGGRSGLATFC